MFSFQPKTKKIFLNFLSVATISLLGVFIFSAQPAEAISLNPTTWIQAIIGFILKLILWTAGIALTVAGTLFDWALGITKFTDAPAVKIGWTITRDLVNMTLVLILLTIAIATILRIQPYGVKALLPKLIGVALLINFSLVFAGVIIDFTQVTAKFFVDQAGGGSFSHSIVKGLSIVDSLKTPNDFLGSIGHLYKTFYFFVIGLAGGVLIIGTAAIMFALGAFILLLRVMALWILLIIMPGAILCLILPSFKGMWTKWVSTFFRYAFFAPIYAFFAYLALVTVKGGAITSQVSSSSEAISKGGITPSNVLNEFFGVETILMYIMVFALLVGGLVVAQRMSIHGASGAMGVAKFIGKGAAGGVNRWIARGGQLPLTFGYTGKAIQKMAERKREARETQLSIARDREDEKAIKKFSKLTNMEKFATKRGKAVDIKRKIVGATFSPTSWKRMWAMRKARSETESFDGAAGSGHLDDGITATTEWLKHPLDREKRGETYSAQLMRAKAVSAKTDEYSKTVRDEDQMVATYKGATTDIDEEAALRQLVNVNGINALFGSMEKKFSPDSFREYLKETFGETEGARIGADVSAIAASRGNFSMVGMTKWDKDKNRISFAESSEQISTAAMKVMEMDFQKFALQVHPDSFFERDTDGKYNGNLHGVGQEIVKNITPAHIAQMSRLQPRTLKALYDYQSSLLALRPSMSPDQQKNLDAFIKKIQDEYTK